MSRLIRLAALVMVVAGFAATPLLAQRSKSNSVSDFGLKEVKKINELITQQWADYEIKPSSLASDGEWARRLHLDILGRIPSVSELDAFLKDSDPKKRMKLVNKLLYDEEYVEDYARNWTTIWTNILINRNGGMERNSLISREGMQKYLRDTFARNKPYDKMVYELVTARGVTAPGAEKFNGAANFLVMKLEDNAAQATAKVSQTFLGLQVQCTQCHNHPFNEWKQQKYWEMNAFFRQTRALRRFTPGTRNIQAAELINQDFAGEGLRKNAQEAAIFYELRNAETKVAYPVFVDGTSIGRSGYISETDRRTELGKLILDSKYMDKTIVNRMWSHFLGYGFTKPIDDLGPHNGPSHPELLDYLATQIRDKSYNLKDLISWIALSRPYALSSRASSNNAKLDDPLMGESPKFSRFYLRQMRAEELYESLLVATRAHKTRSSYEEQERQKGMWLRQFVVAFGNDEGEETTTFNGSIPQALMMFNGDLVKRATTLDKGSFLTEIAADSKMRPSQKINYLFKAALGRVASKDEIDIANKLLVARKGNAAAALQDVWWAVLNTNEFILNH